ncbi:MAG: nucleotidyltransferase domain-containing protein [Deltaproteobacteria bacterium]|nr:nucleotidyltransferase domain-containing protein [Deltaproteobacteria bacterium]
MTDLRQDVLDAIRGICRTAPAVRRAWLFGSRARGDAGARADIDLAIEAPGIGDREWTDLWTALKESLPTLLRIDVVRWEQASERLRQNILAEGVVLHDATRSAA